MAYKTKLLEACLQEHARDERRQVHDAHLTNVPSPHSRIVVLQQNMSRLETATIVAKPDIVATLAKVESMTIVTIRAISTSTLKEPVHQKHRIASLSVHVLLSHSARGLAAIKGIGRLVVTVLWG